MIQENGMPIEFQLRQRDKVVGFERWDYNRCGWIYSSNGILWGERPSPEFICEKDQAIGATDTSDPPQELYFGDLIEFNLDKKDVVGEIVWLNFAVWVRVWQNEMTLSYLFMSHVLDYFKIKKLGSRYDPKMKEVLKKAKLKDPPATDKH